jgi:hypothetical protein
MHSIPELIQKIHIDLFLDEPVYITLGLAFILDEIKRIKDDSSVLSFDNWSSLSEGITYDDEWFDNFKFDITKRAFKYNLPNCSKILFETSQYHFGTSRNLELIQTAIVYNSLECIDIVLSFLPHPGAEIYLGGPTMLSQALAMRNTVVAEHLYSKHNLHPDGLKVIDAQGTFEDYTDVDFTVEYGSCLVYIMTSPHLSLLDKMSMMHYAISHGANPNGHSPQAECFDSPIQVAASIHVCLLEFFLSLEMDVNYSIDELIFYTVSSKASFDQKQKILELLIDEYDIGINEASERTGYSPVEWAILKNGKDAYQTVSYLIERGAVYDVNTLMELAQEHHHFALRDTLYHQLHGSEGIYQDLLNQEVEIRATLAGNGEPRIIVVFPEKGY